MNAKRIFFVCVTLAIFLQSMLAVSATVEVSPRPSFKSLFRQASAQLGLTQRTLLKLDSAVRVLGYHLHKPRTTNGLYDMLAEVRELLHTCVDNLEEACTRLERLYAARRLLLNAQQDKIATILLVLQAIETRLGKFAGVLEIAIHRLNILRENGAISDVDASFMNSKLDVCRQNSSEIQETLLRIAPLLQAGSAENARDLMEHVLRELRFSGSVEEVSQSLDGALRLVGQTLEYQAQVAARVAECRGSLSEIQTIVRKLRSRCAIHCPRGSSEVRASERHFASKAHMPAQVFSLTGRLMGETSAAAAAEVLVHDSLALPNGVYLLVFTSKSESDRTLSKTIRKIVIVR